MAKKLSERDRERKEARRLERRRTERKNNISNMIKAICILVAGASLITFCIWGSMTLYDRHTSSNSYLLKYTPLKSEHFTVDNAMMTYYYYDGYYGFLDYSKSQLSTYGLDNDKYLDTLEFGAEGYDTWHDYFVQSAVAQTQEMMILAEEGISNGIMLDDSEKAALRTRAENTDLSKFPGVTVDDIVRALELNASGMKYSNHLKKTLAPTKEEVEKEYKQYPKYYQYIDYRCIEIPYTTDSFESVFTEEQAEEQADKFKSCNTDEAFTKQLTVFLNESGKEYSEEAKEDIHQNSFAKEKTYSEGDIVSEWLFSETRKAGDTYVYNNKGSGAVTAYMVTKAPYVRDDATATVRHILFRTGTYGSEAAANEKAQEIYSRFMASDKTAETFANLALAYSDDAGSAYAGGMYENFAQGSMVKEFDEWSFDQARKPGDTAVIDTSYGTHIIYYVAKGDPYHLAAVKNDLISMEYDEIGEEANERVKITADESALGKLKSARGAEYYER